MNAEPLSDDLRALYTAHGVRPSDEVIAYCWVGHRSAVDLFALYLIGYDHLRNYLGSWEEWSTRMETMFLDLARAVRSGIGPSNLPS